MSTFDPDWAKHARADAMRRPCGCRGYRHDGDRINVHDEDCLVSHARRLNDPEAHAWLEHRNWVWFDQNPWRAPA